MVPAALIMQALAHRRPPATSSGLAVPPCFSQTTLSEADHSLGGQRFPDNSTNTAEFAEERTRLQKNNKLESTRAHVSRGKNTQFSHEHLDTHRQSNVFFLVVFFFFRSRG